MVTVIIGIILIAFCAFACTFLGWGGDVVQFLKGFAPCLAAFAGLMAILIGLADIKDKRESKKEAADMEREKEETLAANKK